MKRQAEDLVAPKHAEPDPSADVLPPKPKKAKKSKKERARTEGEHVLPPKPKKAKKAKKSERERASAEAEDVGKAKKAKKAKKAALEGAAAADKPKKSKKEKGDEPASASPPPAPAGDKLSRSDRRQKFWDERRAAAEARAADKAGAADKVGDKAGAAAEEAGGPEAAPAGKKKRRKAKAGAEGRRYLLFVGNMAYTTKLEHVFKHFGRFGGLIDVRMATDRETGRFKGTCFVEYDNSESHGKALGLHHSLLTGRKINVELTVGGGGRGANRLEKLQAKNARHKGTGGPSGINAMPLGKRRIIAGAAP